MEPTSCPRVRTSPRRTRTPYLPLQLYEFPLTPAPPRAIHGCRGWSGGFKSLADVAFPLVRIVNGPAAPPHVSIIALAKSRRSMVAMLWQGCSGINLYWERRFLAMLVARRSCSARRGLFAVARGQNFRKDAKDAKKALFFASMRFAKKTPFCCFCRSKSMTRAAAFHSSNRF